MRAKQIRLIGLTLLVVVLITIGANGIRIHDYLATIVAGVLIPIVIVIEVHRIRT